MDDAGGDAVAPGSLWRCGFRRRLGPVRFGAWFAQAPEAEGGEGTGGGSRLLPLWVFALGGCFTACVYLLPGDMFDVAYRSVSLRVAYEAFGALAGFAFAYVLVGRGRDTPGWPDYLTAAALVVGSVASLCFLAIPTAHDYGYTSRFAAWSSAGAGLLEGVVLVAATLAPAGSVPLPRRAAVTVTLAGAGVACLLVAGLVLAAGSGLPLAISQSLSPVSRHTVLPAGSGAIALVTLASAILLALAAVRLTASARSGDPLGRWLAAGLVAGALAEVNFAVFPTEYSPWVDAGDILEFAFSLALVAGVAGEVRQYWRRLVGAAVLEERRRIARDLHDGVAQELAFIVLEAEGAAVAPSPADTLRRIAAAAERARMEVRLAVAAFMEPLDSSVLLGAERTARDVARARGDLAVETTGVDFEATPAERDALQWITREAVSNAIRHGGARRVRLRFAQAPSRLYRVVDDGDGFDGEADSAGFGVTIMRERARRAGGTLSIRSLSGIGTAVQVVFQQDRTAGRPGTRRSTVGASRP